MARSVNPVKAVLVAIVAVAVLAPAGAAEASGDLPVANNDTYRGGVNEILDVTRRDGVLRNDTDPEGDRLTAALTWGPFIGDVDLRPDGSFTYTPELGAQGTDFFYYSVFDGTGYSYAQVNIDVPGPPVAWDDRYVMLAGTSLLVDAPGVLANDFDWSPEGLRVERLSSFAHGKGTVKRDGSVRYAPDPGFVGVDTMTYRVTDSEFASVPATIYVIVKATNAAPTPTPDSYVLAEDTWLSDNVLANDTDPDADPLSVELVSYPSIGDLEFYPDGSFTFIPYPDFDSDVTFTYRVSDGLVWSDPVEVYIDMFAVNDPPIAESDYFGGTQDSDVVVGAPGVLANDFDSVEGDSLTAVAGYPPANGTVTVNSDGSFVYTPNPGFTGFDYFGYAACDGGGCSGADVLIEIFSNE